MHCAKRCFLFLLIAMLAASGATIAALAYAAQWLSAADQPQKADAILVLAGGFARPFQAADLYRRGWAPKIYISVPERFRDFALLDEAGIAYPREEEVMRQVLLKKGVPASAIAYFGTNSISTADEAEAARKLFAAGSPKLLVVSSAYHLRRARIIFSDALPQAQIRMIASSYDPFPTAWWRDQNAARNVLLETAKLAFYQLGGRY